MFAKLRVRIFNWFAAGKLTLTYEKPQEYEMGNTYTIGGNNGALSIGPSGVTSPTTSQTVTIKITPANGGTIICVHTAEYNAGEYHVIPDGLDFDRELGKIITVSKLKS
jgi:hypothetical protein